VPLRRGLTGPGDDIGGDVLYPDAHPPSQEKFSFLVGPRGSLLLERGTWKRIEWLTPTEVLLVVIGSIELRISPLDVE